MALIHLNTFIDHRQPLNVRLGAAVETVAHALARHGPDSALPIEVFVCPGPAAEASVRGGPDGLVVFVCVPAGGDPLESMVLDAIWEALKKARECFPASGLRFPRDRVRALVRDVETGARRRDSSRRAAARRTERARDVVSLRIEGAPVDVREAAVVPVPLPERAGVRRFALRWEGADAAQHFAPPDPKRDQRPLRLRELYGVFPFLGRGASRYFLLGVDACTVDGRGAELLGDCMTAEEYYDAHSRHRDTRFITGPGAMRRE